jgi:hypothetical protein
LLLEFLAETRDRAAELRKQPGLARDPAYLELLENYWDARDQYLVGLAREGEGELAGAIELYLASSRHSLYFTPAYARMVTIIEVLVEADRPRALELWRRLEEAQPRQPLGRQMLPRLFESGNPGGPAEP